MSKNRSAVLDVNSENLTLVVTDNKYINRFVYEVSKSYSGYQNGDFLDIKELETTIAQMVSEAESATFSKIDSILVGLPGEFISILCKNVSKNFGQRRKVLEKDIDGLFLEGNCDIPPQYVVINASPIYFVVDDDAVINAVGKSTVKLSGYISYSLTKTSVKDIFDNFSKVLNIHFIYTSSTLAEVMYVLPSKIRDDGAVFVDIGYISSTVAIVQGDGILYSKSFSLGGGHIAGDLMEILDIPYINAYELHKKLNLNIDANINDKYRLSIEGKNFAYDIQHVNDIAGARLVDICNFIQKVIDAYPHEIPMETEIFLTGSGVSSIVGSVDTLQAITNRKVNLVAPSLLQYKKPSHSSLAGLLMVQQTQAHKGRNNIIQFLKDIFRRKSKWQQ